MMAAGRRFRPRPWSIALTLAGVGLFAGLGLWQLERAAFKQQLEDRFEQRLAEPYREYAAVAATDDLRFRRLVFAGRFVDGHDFLLDNRTRAGRAGYEVLTPLRLAGGERMVLVNRGWAAWGATREPLPAVPPAPASGRVRGIVSIPARGGFRLGRIELKGAWPELIPYLDIDALRAQYSAELLPFVLWLAAEEPGRFERSWDPLWLPPENSRAYAVQWFSFAGIALALFFVLNLRKVK